MASHKYLYKYLNRWPLINIYANIKAVLRDNHISSLAECDLFSNYNLSQMSCRERTTMTVTTTRRGTSVTPLTQRTSLWRRRSRSGKTIDQALQRCTQKMWRGGRGDLWNGMVSRKVMKMICFAHISWVGKKNGWFYTFSFPAWMFTNAQTQTTLTSKPSRWGK